MLSVCLVNITKIFGIEMLIETQILENFFDDPESVKNFAISSKYYPCNFYQSTSIYSGYRCTIQDEKIESEIISKIKKILDKDNIKLSSCFHLNTNTSMLGFPHHDSQDPRSFAAVIYLNENAPVNTGTSIFKNKSTDYVIENYTHKMQIVYDVSLPPNNSIKQKFAKEIFEYKQSLTLETKSENVFNRIFLYSSKKYHSPNLYFGKNIHDGRLTIAIHGSIYAN
jgi:hypothetical protein